MGNDNLMGKVKDYVVQTAVVMIIVFLCFIVFAIVMGWINGNLNEIVKDLTDSIG